MYFGKFPCGYGEIINIGGKMEDIESIWDYGNTFICWALGGGLLCYWEYLKKVISLL